MWKFKCREGLKCLPTCCSRSRANVEYVPIRNEWENTSQTDAILEKTMIVITKILVCGVTGGVAECGHVIYISRQCEMRAQGVGMTER